MDGERSHRGLSPALMAYQVLARKYRPQLFADVAGQEHVTRTLLNALAQSRTAHGYIFSGHRGIGKTTIARILAMALNCQRAIGSAERPTPEPCGACDSCVEIRAGSAVDVIEIDAATNRGIDEVRELRDAARYRPARDRYKIYILDEAHQITDAAFNALLKTLEEPPEHVIFMMATTQPEDIPQTIRSRSQHFSFHAVKFDDILNELRGIAVKEGILTEENALALLAEAGDGSMRDALSIMDQAIASAPVEDGKPHLDAEQIRELMGTVPNTVFERLLESVSENQSTAILEEANRLLNAGNSPSQLARQFVRYLRNALMAKLGGDNTELLQISADERARVARTAMLFSEEDLMRFLQVMLRTFDELNYRQEGRFRLELGLMKLVHMQRLIPLEQLLSQLPGGVTRVSRGASAASRATPSAQSPIPEPPQSPSVRPATHRPAADHVSTPDRPAFSPFEADSKRKSTGGDAGPKAKIVAALAAVLEEPATPEIPETPAPVLSPEAQANAVPEPNVLRQTLAELVMPEEPTNKIALRAEPAELEIDGHSTPEEERRIAAAEEELAEDEPAGASELTLGVDLARLRNAVSATFEENGHHTAAALLAAGRWSVDGDTIVAEVGVKKTMLSLTMNPEAERIARKAMLDAGTSLKLRVVSSEGGALGKDAAPVFRPATSGSIQAQALDNPLVKQAQELFRAEVRSVLDLRDKDLR